MRVTARICTVLFITACVIIGFVLLSLRFSPFVHAQTQQYTALTGYAWSDTIGWISMNCDNTDSCASNDYSISIGSNGTLSGYAWSDNIGWVSANHADVAYCETNYGGDDPQIQNGQVTGWLRAISGNTSESGGWDGCISLSGSDYGVTVADEGTFSGYAWGDINVGWTDFSLVREEMSAGSCSGQFIQNGACVTSCTSGFTTPPQGNVCIEENCPVGSLPDPTTGMCTFTGCPSGYTEITGSNGPECQQNQCLAGATVCEDGNAYQQTGGVNSDGSCILGPEEVCNWGCDAGIGCLPQPSPTAYITASPTLVVSGGTSNISWSAQSVSSCTIDGSNEQDTSCTGASCAATTSETSLQITGETTYVLDCKVPSSSDLIESATVNIAPSFCETGAPNCL